jgi:hypothetical protein
MSEPVADVNAYAANQHKAAPIEPVVACPFAGKHVSLAVEIVGKPHPDLDLAKCLVRVSNESGFSKTSPSPAQFAELAPGFYTVDVVFPAPTDTRPHRQAFVAQSRRIEVVPGEPAAAVMAVLTDEPLKLEVKSERTRAMLEGHSKLAGPVEFQLTATAGRPTLFDGQEIFVDVSRADVALYADRLCKTKLALGIPQNRYKLSAAELVDLKARKPVTLWAVPETADAFTLTLSSTSGVTHTKSFLAALEFLDGSSKFLQLVDSFETVDEIVHSMPRVRSIAALVDMKADEFANFAIKRLVIRKGVLEQVVRIAIDPPALGRAYPAECVVPLFHPDGGQDQPLYYSDFIVDRSGPKFLGALDADVAVEALMYKDACITTLLHSLQKNPKLNKQTGAMTAKADAFASSLGVDLIDNVCKLARDRYTVLKDAPDNRGKYAELSESEIEKALSVYQQKHMAARRLSDFDLTARDADTFSRAIVEKLKVLKPHAVSAVEYTEEMTLAIGWQAWSRGGPIETKRIAAAVRDGGTSGEKAKRYVDSVASEPTYFAGGKTYTRLGYRATDFYHLLIREIGPAIEHLLPDPEVRVDNFYGLGVPFFGPEVYEENDALHFHNLAHPVHAKPGDKPREASDYKEEIGDIINDETSHYGKVLSHNANIHQSLLKIGKSTADFDRSKNFRENGEKLIKASGNPAEIKRYTDRAAFMDTMMMFEQIAKKEAQSQLYKRDLLAAKKKSDAPGVKKHAGKLMGNVSDVSQFLFGVDIAKRVAITAGKPDTEKLMVALLQTTMLSACIAMPRWGINAGNVDLVTDSASYKLADDHADKLFTAQTFAESINERSYSHFAATHPDAYVAPRVHVEWALIDTAIGKQRLKDFTQGMAPVWDFLHDAKQKPFFRAMDALIVEIGKVPAVSRTLALDEVRKEMGVVLDQLPELVKLIGGSRPKLIEALVEQCEESAMFQVERAKK